MFPTHDGDMVDSCFLHELAHLGNGMEAGVGDGVDCAVDHIGHVGGAVPDVFSVFACEEIVHGALEQGEPALELGFPHLS